MLKKIKNLTLDEMRRICSENPCNCCPLKLKYSSDCIFTLENRCEIKEKLEEEIEVLENEN